MKTTNAIIVLSLFACAAAAGCDTAHAAEAHHNIDRDAELAVEAQLQAPPRVSQTGRAKPATNFPSAAQIPQLKCVQAASTTWKKCKDAGGFDSACAIAKCGAGYTLTGGGGSCSAGNRKLKGLNPNVSKGEFGIMCEDQGVKPRAQAICCKL
ncbi:MAG: hypothetical protein AAF721_18940 [Myxococcota bacterium]